MTDLLEKAAKNPQARPEFLAYLAQANVYCLAIDPKQNTQALNLTERIQFQKWENSTGQAAIPFFLSLEELERSVQAPHPYVCLSSQQLFKMTKGETLVLHPMSPYGRAFLPHEIEFLISMPKAQEPDVVLGKPEPMPKELLAQLRQVFVQHTNIKRAYIAMMYLDIKSEPKTVVGVEVTQDVKAVMDVLDALDVTCEFIQIQQDTVSEYMLNETQPFYEQK
ncbi:enhanced serine sensitivity protein SseB C-terminal domain-containing protein [Acinetobacter sp. HY1485]|uniref:enhanced serine sensitivity protein SseB C-terminal domain-containing protein n=1 Tax=Acinetobacter sp. HY1485 TaxID=2970918 RepID=UPI0022B9C28E|nr:enhanced serine sensitivity protein SseB C-terminal domain-containing protein [Acinetobacter sp. HY1485]